MSVAEASKQAYGRLRTVSPKEHPVYKFLKTFGTQSAGYSNRQIAAILGKPINTITPRVFELRQAGVVVLAGKRKDLYSGIEVSHWRIASEAEEAASREPRTFATLADVPEGVTALETGPGVSWYWKHVGGGKFSSSSTGESWSAPAPLTACERTYGPAMKVVEG